MRQERFDTPGKVEVVVDNKLGDVRLHTHAEPTTEVELRANGSRGDEIVGQSRVEHRHTGGKDKVIVELPMPGGLLWRSSAQVVVTVRLPEGADVDVETISGTVSADGRLGAASVRTASGDISLGPVGGDLVARGTSGDVTVGQVAGGVDITTASGSVRCGDLDQAGHVKTATGDVDVVSAGGRLTVETASGDVTAGQLAAGCDLKTVSGDQRVRRLLAGEADFHTVSGDMTIGVARGTAVMIDAESLSGSLSSEIDLAPEEPANPLAEHDEGRRATLRAHSLSGDVRIQRATA